MLQNVVGARDSLSTLMAETDIQRFSGPWPFRRVRRSSPRDDQLPRDLFDNDIEVETVDPSHVSLNDIDPRERSLVANAVDSRQREFAAGRLCVRRALARLRVPDSPLLADADRLPRWPDEIAGSISHVSDMCGAVVARRPAVVGLGFDIESALDLPPDSWRIVLTDGEREMLNRFSRSERGLQARLLFSAKEAFYKCYRSAGGGWLDFNEVELRPTPSSDDMELRVEKPLAMSGLGVEGRYALTPRFIYTAFTAR